LKPLPGRHVLLGALALTAGCSLHSLDYLEAGGRGAEQAAPAGAGSTAGASSGESGGTLDASVGGVAGLSSNGAAGAQLAPPDCGDQQTTGDETDVDCGGRTCHPCPAERRCITGTDCESAICTNQVCQPPTCTDLALNGDETDLNCGGSCPPCPLARRCITGTDCATGSCILGLCESVTCVDGVLQANCPLLVDGTPYALSPSHALDRCVEDDRQSVAEGTAMLLAPCKAELQQTFWAVGLPGGSFALRSALSGKCLQVRGASTVAGAVVEQSACSYAAEQLWKPSIVDSSLMLLTSQLSTLVLDVAGVNVAKNGQAIVQSPGDGSADTHWRVTKRTEAAYVTFSPNGDQTLRVRHDSRLTSLSDDDQTSAHWKVVPGLYDASLVSFQARNDPGRYLRHASFQLWSDSNDASTQFKRDATFRYVSPFVGSAPLAKGLEASNYPGYFWLQSGTTIVLGAPDDKSSATWWIGGR